MIPIISYSEKETYLDTILNRQASFDPRVDAVVSKIIDDVRMRGDEAVLEYTEQFDRVRPRTLKAPTDHIYQAHSSIPERLTSILQEAASNIRRFHERQLPDSWFMEDGDGVVMGQRVVPIEKAGVYVPGGTAFYPSSLLMNVIPAQVAGVQEIHLVSPPQHNGLPHPLVLGAAYLLGIEHVYPIGGAQAIAALATGTSTIPKVDKIVGPGNVYVATAKKQVYGTVDIDSVAGPSEIVVLADATADPLHVAADLLSQAEHDERASAILVTTHRELAEQVQARIAALVPTLSRQAILEKSIATYSACIITDTLEEALDFVNQLAPEHLELIVESPWEVMTHIRHAGAIFLGPYSTEPVGDYFAGPNHVLPTGGTARYASALSVDDFIRKQSVIHYTRERLQKTGDKIIDFANAEGLTAHALAVSARLENP